MERLPYKLLFFSLCLYFIIVHIANAQCLVINEVLVNGAGTCDGWCNPNTEEWTEIYNTCDTAFDASCYILTNGKFTVVFPESTYVAAHDYLVVGSNNSGGTVNINLANCNCANGTLIGTFANNREQVILADPSGNIIDGVCWNGGRFPVNITSASFGTCVPATISSTVPNLKIFNVGSSGGQGCSIARVCDGSASWVQRCDSAVTMGKTNGKIVAGISASGNTSLCAGETVTLQSDLSGTSYQWVLDGNPIQGATTRQYIADVAGEYSVSVSGTVCNTIPDSISILLYPSPIASTTPSGTITRCTPVALLANNATTYQWLYNGMPVSGATEISFIAAETGSYSIISTNQFGCTDTSDNVLLSFVSTPIAYFTSTTLGLQATFDSDSSDGAIAFEWSFGDGERSNIENPVHTYNIPGSYKVCLTVYNNSNCTYTLCKDLKIDYLLSEPELSSIRDLCKIYPNPFNSKLLITFKGKDNVKNIELYSLLGELILLTDNCNRFQDSWEINTTHFSDGVYYLKIRTEDTEYFEPLIKISN